MPFIADLKPSGQYVMEDVQRIGGTPAVMKYLMEKGFIDGSCLVSKSTQVQCAHQSSLTPSSSLSQTVTGKTVAENLKDLPGLSAGQEIIMPVEKPIKATGHLQILYGNLAPVSLVSCTEE